MTVFANNTYYYRVWAVNAGGFSAVPSNTASATILPPPVAPSPVTATAARQGQTSARVTLIWTNVANETGYRIRRVTDAAFTANLVTSTVSANVTTFTTGNVARFTPFYFRVQAFNVFGASVYVNAVPFSITTL